MQAQLPKPPIPADVDLHDFSFTPIFRTQLFRSAFHARATDAEWRAGVTLWLKSWDQMPAGSLPDNDVELCRLAEFGADRRKFARVKAIALHGWFKCNDSRLYHRVVAEGVMAAYLRRRSSVEKGKLGASKRWAVIEGGLANSQQPLKLDSSANSSANGPATQNNSPGNGSAIAQAMPTPMPGDSNRQGQGQGERHTHSERVGGKFEKAGSGWKPPTEEEIRAGK